MSQIAWQQRVLAAPVPQSDWQSRVLGTQPSGPDRSWAGEAAVGVRRGFDSLLPQLWSGATSALRTIGSTGDGRQDVDTEGRVIQSPDDSPYGRLMSYMDQTERAMTREQGELLATMPRSPRSGMWDARGIAGDLGEATPQMAAAIGAGAAAAPMGLAAGIAAFSGTAAAPVMGQTYQDALKEHGNPERAAREAFANGSVTAVTSILPGMAFLRRMPGGNKVVEAITSRVIGRLGVRAVAEGGQEAAEQVGQIATEELVRRGASPEQAVAAVAGRLDEVGYAALLGSVMGAGASVGLEAATGRSAAPTLPQDRPVSQPTTGPSEVAPTQPEPATTPTRGPMAAAAVQTPEGVVEYVSRNPERAAQMPEKPSRGQMGEFGIAGNTTAQQRARIAADIRAEYRRQQAAGELAAPAEAPVAPATPTIAQEVASDTQPDGRRVDGPEQQGPADAQQAVQVPASSPEVSRPDQPGSGRPARPRQPFSRQGVIEQLAEKARQYLPPRTSQEDLEQAHEGDAQGLEFSTTFPDRIPPEILEKIEGEPHLLMQLRIAKPGERAGGPDSLSALGEDRYVQHLRESHQSETGRIVEGLASSGAADIDPEIKMLLWLEEHRITGRKIPQSTATSTLVEGDTFTIHGEQFAVRLDDDDRRVAIQSNDSDNSLVIDLDAVENIPVDRDSLVKPPKAQPPATQPYRSEAISKPTKTDLLGQPMTEPNTGRQAELLTKGREDDTPASSLDDKIRNKFKDADTPINPSLTKPTTPTAPVSEKPSEQENLTPEPATEPTQDGDTWIDDGGAGAGNPHLPLPLRTGARPEERIVTARWEYTPDIDTSVIPARIAKNLQPHQSQAAAAAWTAMHRGSRGFLLASGTGAGKTRSILAVAQMHMQAENRPVVVVAPNEVLGKPASNRGIVSGSYANDAKAMGLDFSLIKSASDQIRDGQLYYTTYEHAHKLDIPSNAVVVFDEAHALKNAIATQSQRGMRGTKIIDNAHAVLFASATPADKAIHVPYLQRAGVFEGRTQDEQLRYLDMTERIQKDRSGRIVSRTWVPRHDAQEVLQRLDALFARLTLNGQMIKHEINFSGVDVGIQRIRLPREAHRVLDDIARAFPGGGLKQALRLMHQRRQQEPYKVQAVADAVEQAIKAGRRPIVFLARVNYAEAVKRVRDRETGEIISEEVIAASDATSKLLKDELRRRGITKIAELHGESDTNAAEAMRQFQGDEAEAMIATVQSGGTGVNLDDTVGNRPRTLIMMTPPFSAVDNVQAFGRVWRLSTKSNPQIRVVLGDTETDQWNAGIIAAKMRTLGATVSGESRRMVSDDGEQDGDVQAMMMPKGQSPAGFNLPRQAVPVDPNRPQPITPGRVPIKGPISEHQIRTRMERDFGEPIRRNRVKTKALGQHDDRQRTIRIVRDRFGDIGVAAHEVAHGIDTNVPKGRLTVVKSAPADVRAELAGLDYDQTKARPSEGFAEFVRYAITHDDVAQRSPKTTAWFQQTFLPANPDVARKLGTARAMATQWRGQTPQQRVQANVNPTNQPRAVTTPSETVTDHVRAGWSKFYRQWVSDGDPVFEMVRAAKRRGSTFSDADNPYAVKSSQQLLGPHLGHESVSGRGILSTRDYRVMHPPLRRVLSGIKDGEYGQFVSFLYARHALESWSKGVNPGITQADAQAVYDEHKGNAAFVKAADGVTSFNNALIDMVAETGAISPSDAANMKAHWQTYIPLARAIGTKGSTLRGMTADLDNPFMGRHGADLPIVDPILTSMRRSLHLFNRAIQQNTIEALASFAENNGGMGQFAERVAPEMMRNNLTVGDIRKQLETAGVNSDEITSVLDDSDALFFYRPNLKGERGSIVRVYRNGEQQLWQLSPDLYESLETQARVGSDWLPAIAIRWASRATRLGATGINPAFTIPNLIRDLTTYFLQSKTRNPLRQAAAIPAAISRMATHHVASLAGRPHEGIVELYERMGGQIAGRLAADYAELAQARQKALDSPIQRKALRIVTPRGLWGVIGGTLNVVRDTINFTESAPRLAEFTESLRRDGFTEKNLNDVTREALIRAFNAASDVTTNFRRAGTKGRAVNQYVPFFNAQIQGIDKMLRTLRDQPGTALMRLTPLLAMTALMWAARKDDDEYKEEPDWLKYGFWNITQNGRVVARIPRPFDWGWVFLSGFEATLDAIDKRDPQVIQDYLAALTEKMAPNFIPAGVEQGIETTFNVDLFKSNLLAGEFVPIVDENGLGRFKDRDQTTPDSTLLARWAGQTLGMSPAKVDHFLDGVTGGATSRYMRFFETFDVQDFALSGVTVKNDYMRSIGDFYRDAAEAEKAWMSSRITDGNTDELGPGDQALADRNHAFGWYAGVMSELRDLVPKESTRDERYAVNRYIAGLARQAMGKEPLEQFPNPFQSRDLPPEVAAVIRQNREGLMRSARIDAQTPRSREQVRRARMMLRNLASPDPAR